MESYVLPVVALVISLMSLGFSVFSWREIHRPIVTARLQVRAAGNVGAALELIVENTGNRPAVNVRLTADPENLEKALLAPKDDCFREHVEYCFSEESFIPCLAPGQVVSTGFGRFLNDDLSDESSTWAYKSVLDIRINYTGIKKKRWPPISYTNVVPIWLVNNTGFALSYWGKK